MAKNNKGKNSKSNEDDDPIELDLIEGEDTMKKNDSNDSKKTDPLGDKLLFDEPKKKHHEEEHEDHNDDNEESDDDEDKFINLEDVHEDRARSKSKSEKSDYIHVKIPKLNILWAERIVYWIIIIVLLILVFKGPVANLFSTDNMLGTIDQDDQANSGNNQVPVANTTQTSVTQNQTASSNNANSNNNSASANSNTASTANNTKPADKTCADGTPSIEITSVIMDDDNDKKVINVKAKIVNSDSDALENYNLDLTWWNKDDLDEGLGLDTKQRLKTIGTAKYMVGPKTIAKCGGTLLLNLDDELQLPYVTTRDETNTFKLILRTSSGKEITSDTYTLAKV